MTKPFRFKQFDIYHDKCAMKVGTDGVLLGAWCGSDNAHDVLDIGTGSGLIAIMLAQKNTECIIDAVEIDDNSFAQASANASLCPWSSRIKIHHIPFQEFQKHSERKYDLIVSNPPWFRNSLLNPDSERSAARHSWSLSTDELIAGINKLLNREGKFCMIMPVPEALLFIENAAKNNLYCRKQTNVLPNPGKPPKRILMEFRYDEGETDKSELIIELGRRHQYSDDFKALTKDFYLYFLH